MRGRLAWWVAAALAAILAVNAGEPADTGTVDYVEASEGLKPPEFEGGDSEFEFGDVDNDGHLDLVSVGDHGNPLINTDQQGILVWLGDGTGRWTHVHRGHLGYGGIALGDVDRDGTLDVGYGIHHDYADEDLGDARLEVALGDGSGAGWTPWDDGLDAPEHGMTWGMFASDFGDVDGDGQLDLGSAAFGSADGLHVYLSDGDGTWRRSFGFLAGNVAPVFEFADIDGDGHLDIVTGKQEGTAWLGDGAGGFRTADGHLPPAGGTGARRGTSTGDLDRDGRDDLAYCTWEGEPEVWLARGPELWESVTAGLATGGLCQFTELADMDADGTIELVTFGRGEMIVQRPEPGFTGWTRIGSLTTPDDPGTARALRVGGDFDHNGRPDVALLNEQEISWFEDQNQLRVYRETTPVTELAVRLLRPGPSRLLRAGSIRSVEWATAVPAGEQARIDLEVSTTGADGPFRPLAADELDDGHYPWLVPPRASDDCWLRVTARTATDTATAIGPGPFAIARPGDPLRLTLPGQETIAWDDDLGRERVNLYRGDWQRFLDTGHYSQDPAIAPAARFCDRAATEGSLPDPYRPVAGTMVFYLATAYRLADDGVHEQAPMAESRLGRDARAMTRPHHHPCPPAQPSEAASAAE
jgi:hypothetical protein